ncbi:hypothetical protein EDD11_003649 [Mortierella claussenii]|nr:hypothetical protein EDD11_003649 [Mortierella claussenii]
MSTHTPVVVVTTLALSFDVKPTSTATTSSASITVNPSNINNTTNYGASDDFQTSGGYIYIILMVSLTIAFVYFLNVFLAKRREKIRLEKERSCEEVPPEYFDHAQDLQVFAISHSGGGGTGNSNDLDSNHHTHGNNSLYSSQPARDMRRLSRIEIPVSSHLDMPTAHSIPNPPAYDDVQNTGTPPSSCSSPNEDEGAKAGERSSSEALGTSTTPLASDTRSGREERSTRGANSR